MAQIFLALFNEMHLARCVFDEDTAIKPFLQQKTRISPWRVGNRFIKKGPFSTSHMCWHCARCSLKSAQNPFSETCVYLP